MLYDVECELLSDKILVRYMIFVIITLILLKIRYKDLFRILRGVR